MEEFKKVLAAEKDRRYKLIYSLGMGSGLRISEIIGYRGMSRKKNTKTLEIVEKEVVIPKPASSMQPNTPCTVPRSL